MNTAIKLKTCAVCKEEFSPFQTTQKVCSPSCALKYKSFKLNEKQKKQNRAAVRELKANDRSYQLRLAQAEFNKSIRLRDDKEPCISCQRHHDGQYHAGHYLSVGAFPELRFEEDNCHKQCSACNNHLSGNIAAYRINLIKKIGLDRVEKLETTRPPKKYSLDEIVEIKNHFKFKAKELQTKIDQSVSGI